MHYHKMGYNDIFLSLVYIYYYLYHLSYRCIGYM